jgi:sulfide:quinone oxidoreductase
LRYFAGGRIVIAVAGVPYKGPTAPYEAAMLLEHRFHSRRMRQNVEIALYTPEPLPLPAMGEDIGEGVKGLLAHKGIEFHAGTRIAAVDPQRREASFSDGTITPFQVLITVPEHSPPTVVQEAGLVDETGWVSVNPGSLETVFENVFAVGDLAYLQGVRGDPLPKTGLLAEHQAQAAARNIAYRVRGGEPPIPFQALGRHFLEVGGGAAALIQGDYFGGERGFEMKQPSLVWHYARVAYERYWLLRAY